MKKNLLILCALATIGTETICMFESFATFKQNTLFNINGFSSNITSKFSSCNPRGLMDFSFFSVSDLSESLLSKTILTATGPVLGLTTLAASTYFFNYLNKNNFKIHPNVANLYTHVPLYFIGLYGVQF